MADPFIPPSGTGTNLASLISLASKSSSPPVSTTVEVLPSELTALEGQQGQNQKAIEGTVKAIDPRQGTVTIETSKGDVRLTVPAENIEQFNVGDKVAFRLALDAARTQDKLMADLVKIFSKSEIAKGGAIDQTRLAKDVELTATLTKMLGQNTVISTGRPATTTSFSWPVGVGGALNQEVLSQAIKTFAQAYKMPMPSEEALVKAIQNFVAAKTDLAQILSSVFKGNVLGTFSEEGAFPLKMNIGDQALKPALLSQVSHLTLSTQQTASLRTVIEQFLSLQTKTITGEQVVLRPTQIAAQLVTFKPLSILASHQPFEKLAMPFRFLSPTSLMDTMVAQNKVGQQTAIPTLSLVLGKMPSLPTGTNTGQIAMAGDGRLFLMPTSQFNSMMAGNMEFPIGTVLLGTITPASIFAPMASNAPDMNLLLSSIIQSVSSVGKTSSASLNANPVNMISTTPFNQFIGGLNAPIWDEIEELLAYLSQTMPDAGAALSRTLPNPVQATRLTTTMLFFMTALGAGDLRLWLGDKVRNALSQKNQDLLERLQKSFGDLSRISKETGRGEGWRQTPLPMIWDDRVHILQFYSRLHHYYDQEDEQQSGQGQSKKTVRFFLDLETRRLGDMQIDGLSQGKLLDMIVRSQQPLDPSLRQDLLQRYQAVLQATGLHGDLMFQHNKENWVYPHQDQGKYL